MDKLLIMLESWYGKQIAPEQDPPSSLAVDSLDNPGWDLRASVGHSTLLEHGYLPEGVWRNNTDWNIFSLEEDLDGSCRFIGAGGPLNLSEVLLGFLTWWSYDEHQLIESIQIPADDVALRLIPNRMAISRERPKMDPETSALDWLQLWYLEHCDGDWEHEYGIRLKTLEDEPGWFFQADLAWTVYENRRDLPQGVLRADNDGLAFTNEPDTEGSPRFTVRGGPHHLLEMIHAFREWVDHVT